MEVGSRLRRSQRQSVLSSMLVVIVTLQSLVSNLEWKRYSLHEILPFTNLWWPTGLCPGSPSLGREGGEHLPSLFRTLSLSSQASASLTFLFFPGFRLGSAPERGALPVPLISISQAHTPISLPESLSPATPAALTESLGFFIPSQPVHPYPHLSLSWLQLASGNMFPKGRDCVCLRPVLSPHTQIYSLHPVTLSPAPPKFVLK